MEKHLSTLRDTLIGRGVAPDNVEAMMADLGQVLFAHLLTRAMREVPEEERASLKRMDEEHAQAWLEQRSDDLLRRLPEHDIEEVVSAVVDGYLRAIKVQ